MMKDTLKTLCAAYGATGREGNVASVIADIVRPYVDEMRIDAIGNLICTRKGEGKRIMLAAHMDHIGFVVTDIDEKGFLRVHSVGGINRAVSLNRHVVFESGLSGVLSFETRDADTSTPMASLFIDIGAADRAEAMAMVELGDVAVYAPDVFEIGKNLLSGPAMDNRAGCAVVVEALMKLPKDCPDEVVAVFTTQEEVGLRGAHAAAFDIAPDYGIALDVTLCGDTPKGPRISVKINEGIAIKVMDSSLICTPAVVASLRKTAKENDIRWQTEVLTAGGTDAGAIQLSRGGVPSGVLSIPCRYVHSACETVSIADCEAGADLLAAWLAEPKA